jgi:hypothetical protein
MRILRFATDVNLPPQQCRWRGWACLLDRSDRSRTSTPFRFAAKAIIGYGSSIHREQSREGSPYKRLACNLDGTTEGKLS